MFGVERVKGLYQPQALKSRQVLVDSRLAQFGVLDEQFYGRPAEALLVGIVG